MESDHADWPVTRDHALVLYVDTLCRAWSTTPPRLMPDELLLSDVDLTSEDFHQLQGELTVSFKLYSYVTGITAFTRTSRPLREPIPYKPCASLGLPHHLCLNN